MFQDRADAGLRLSWNLGRYKDRHDALVLAIPRGGMPVGGVLARELDLSLNAMLVGKIEHPDDRGVVIGAVSLTSVDLDPAAVGEGGVTAEHLDAAVESVKAILRQRYWDCHAVVHPAAIAGRTVILTDDEAASGWPMAAAARRLRREGAARIVAAVPAASREAYEFLCREADRVVCLWTVENPAAVAGLYRDFRSVTDAESLEILRRSTQAAAAR
ncbi:MAG: phosphoribosyltransferase family protein [Elusimicrobiota bacterium]